MRTVTHIPLLYKPDPAAECAPPAVRDNLGEMLKILTTVQNEPEAEMVSEWLAEAGIRSVAQMNSQGIRLGPAASRDVYVEEADYERALEVLNAEVPSEQELAALSQAATQPTQPRGRDEAGEPHEPGEIPIPTEAEVMDGLRRAAAPEPPQETT